MKASLEIALLAFSLFTTNPESKTLQEVGLRFSQNPLQDTLSEFYRNDWNVPQSFFLNPNGNLSTISIQTSYKFLYPIPPKPFPPGEIEVVYCENFDQPLSCTKFVRRYSYNESKELPQITTNVTEDKDYDMTSKINGIVFTILIKHTKLIKRRDSKA